jgi:hypothetical protein
MGAARPPGARLWPYQPADQADERLASQRGRRPGPRTTSISRSSAPRSLSRFVSAVARRNLDNWDPAPPDALAPGGAS